LQPEQISAQTAEYIKIVVDAIGVSKPAFESFLGGLNDEQLKNAFKGIINELF